MHRPFTDWNRVERRCEPDTVENRIYASLRRLIGLRKQVPALADGAMQVVDAGNGHVFAYVRQSGEGRVLALCNFSEHEQHVSANVIRSNGLSYDFSDLVTGVDLALQEQLVLGPYHFAWLVAK